MTEKTNENGKSFTFVINNYDENDIKCVKACPCKRIIAGFEEGDDKKTPHIQGAIIVGKAMRIKAVCHMLGGRAHVEKMQGEWSDQTYCAKDGKLLRMEDNSVQGDRVDLRRLRASIEAGATDIELYVDHASSYAKYPRYVGGYKKALQKQAARKFRKVEVEIMWGAPGSFKSRIALYKTMTNDIQDADTYSVPDTPNLKWFEDYDGEKCIVIEEFDGTQCSFDRWKRLVDGHSMLVENKGGGSYALWTKVIICSNIDPDDWWQGAHKDKMDFKRRINKITHIDAKN